MTDYYLTIKALHIISVICWMAAMLYLPRLFVYHVNAKKDGELDRTLKIMERKLANFIMTPSMIASLLFGLMLLHIVGVQAWFHAKSLLLLFLFACHGILIKHMKKFAKNENIKSEKFFRIINEVPAVLMVIIVFLAVIKPF